MKQLFQITFITVLAVLMMVFSIAATCHQPDASNKEQEFVGISKERSFDEALADALKQLDKALAEQGIPDNLASWKVVEITGQIGGIAGLNEVQVKISATFLTGQGKRNAPK